MTGDHRRGRRRVRTLLALLAVLLAGGALASSGWMGSRKSSAAVCIGSLCVGTTTTTRATVPTTTTAVPATTTTVPATTTTAGPTVLFADEFNDTTVDARWSVLNRVGDQSNAEQECYRPGNVAESGGSLRITTKKDATCSYGYTSGMVQWSSFNFTYGTITLRALQAGGHGMWPAQWFLGANCQQSNKTSADNSGPCSWPNPGSDEIDMVETLNSDHSVVYQGVHMTSGSPMRSAPASDTSLNWHTYTLDWRPGRMEWFIDGGSTCVNTTNVPSTPMFLLLNTAVGGNGGGWIDPTAMPSTLQIDYVRITA